MTRLVRVFLDRDMEQNTKLFKRAFEVIDNGETAHSHVKIISGPYEGLVYQYGQVGFSDLPNGEVAMSFTYETLKGDNGFDHKDPLFRTLIGDILVEVMEMQVEANQQIEAYRKSHASNS